MQRRTRRVVGRAIGVAAVALCSAVVPAAAVVFTGSSKSNRVRGTNGADKIFLGAGNDRAAGRGGADRIVGARGRDRLNGGSGRDRLSGGSGADRLVAGKGKDRLLSGSGKDRLAGGSGNDSLGGGSGNDRLAGGSGNDSLGGGSGNDVLGGNSGADLMKGLGGRDRLTGGKGRDRISGGGGNDRLNSVDGARDRRVAGGPGRNFCRIDLLDLRVVSGCTTIVIGNGKGTDVNGGGGSNGGSERRKRRIGWRHRCRSPAEADQRQRIELRLDAADVHLPALRHGCGARARAGDGRRRSQPGGRIVGLADGRWVDRDGRLWLYVQRGARDVDRRRDRSRADHLHPLDVRGDGSPPRGGDVTVRATAGP